MAIEITWYKDDLRDRVIDLFVEEYQVNPQEFGSLFDRFYFHPFQKNKCLLIVALDGETLAGFQSFFFWPYHYGGKSFTSFQSGNSLINPAYRGRGLFNKMLAFVEQEKDARGIDFLMGFPVEASLRNFIKDKWTNILDLRWYLKFCNPFGFSGKLKSAKISEGLSYFQEHINIPATLSLDNGKDFTAWRDNYLRKEVYYTYRYEKGSNSIIFHLKTNKRKKILNELIIGNVLLSSENAMNELPAALRELSAVVRNSFSFHFLSCALNEQCSLQFKHEFEKAGFRATDKKIHFIVKTFKNNSFAMSPEKWVLFRSDIDTW